MNKWIPLAISSITDFAVTAGGAFLAIGGTTLPTTYQLCICGVTGFVQAARGIQHRLEAPLQ